jgi:hypothetical protein
MEIITSVGIFDVLKELDIRQFLADGFNPKELKEMNSRLVFCSADISTRLSDSATEIGLKREIIYFNGRPYALFHDEDTVFYDPPLPGSRDSTVKYIAKNNKIGVWAQYAPPHSRSSGNEHSETVETFRKLLGKCSICCCDVKTEKFYGDMELTASLTIPRGYAHRVTSEEGAINVLVMNPPLDVIIKKYGDEYADHNWPDMCYERCPLDHVKQKTA